MSAPGTMATEPLGNESDNRHLLWAYSRAVMPGVTATSQLQDTPFASHSLHTFSWLQEMRMSFMHRLAELQLGSRDKVGGNRR